VLTSRAACLGFKTHRIQYVTYKYFEWYFVNDAEWIGSSPLYETNPNIACRGIACIVRCAIYFEHTDSHYPCKVESY
jgi:hypothetical protein